MSLKVQPHELINAPTSQVLILTKNSMKSNKITDVRKAKVS